MSKQKIKKVVYFIVEGNTDKTALQNIFQKIYKHRDIRFEFMDGDITSDEDINISNVCNVIHNKLKEDMLQNKLKKNDIWKIVQIFDTDGTYIPDSAVEKGDSKEFIYTTTSILCKYPERVSERNRKKKEIMDYLLKQNEINGIPYQGFYVSSNLDHALYNEQNLTDEEKKKKADQFYKTFWGKEKLFIPFLEKYVVNGVPDSFPISWRYIKEGTRSLERHSNLHVYFKENPYE